jgi:O-antigen ligase
VETSFALFLFSGRYKALPELRGFPFDFTLLFFVTTVVLMAGMIVSGRMKPPRPNLSVLLMLLFTEFAVASVFWSSFDPLNVDKAIRFLALSSTSFFIAYTLVPDRGRRERLVRAIVYISCAILLYYAYYRIVLGIDMNDTRHGWRPEHSDNYLEYASHATFLFIILLSQAVFGARRYSVVAAFGVGAASFALLVIGGRGPLMAALLAIPLIVLGVLMRRGESMTRLGRLAGLAVGVLALAAVSYVGFESFGGSLSDMQGQFRTLDRYELQFSNEDTSSVDERLRGQDLAFHMWTEKPIFGWGIGEFTVTNSYLKYPHNIVLEILCENGLIGALLFLSVCAAAVAGCVRIAQDRSCGWPVVAIALLFLTDFALHLTVQGYLADDRIFLAYLGMAIGASAKASGPVSRRVIHQPRTPLAATATTDTMQTVSARGGSI